LCFEGKFSLRTQFFFIHETRLKEEFTLFYIQKTREAKEAVSLTFPPETIPLTEKK
jgi:hypothetical protein